MQTIKNPKMDWQIEPTKKLISNDPARIGSKFELEKKDEKRIQLGKLLQKIIQNPPFPDYRYSCAFCGSLDVFITVNEDAKNIHISCLDCNKIWFEDKLVNLEVTKQCLC